MSFCVPKEQVEKLKSFAQKTRIDVGELLNMTTKERRDFFKKSTDDEMAKFINTEFEKAKVKYNDGSAKALMEWAESTFDPKLKKPQLFKGLRDKIEMLQETGALSNEGALDDFVESTLGGAVTKQEADKLLEHAAKVDKAQSKLGENLEKLGNPNAFDDNLAFWKAKSEADQYINSITPAAKSSVLTNTIRKGSMLARVSTNTLNILGSWLNRGFKAGTVRVRETTLKGAAGIDKGVNLKKQYAKMSRKIFKETGYDISRMIKLEDDKKLLGEKFTHAEGEGTIRKVGRFFENTTFKVLGISDNMVATSQFVDSAGLLAKQFAKKKGLKGQALIEEENKLLREAFSLSPLRTAEGDILREIAVVDAMKATYTETGSLSTAALDTKNLINKYTGAFNVGDLEVPFVKTPANVIEQSMDTAGLGMFKGLIKLYKGLDVKGKALRGTLKGGVDERMVRDGVEDLTRAGVGLLGAAVFVSTIKPDDFMGAYDYRRTDEAQLKNANYNAIRIGDKWISLDYLGPLQAPITGMLYAKKYGGDEGIMKKAERYAQGAGRAFLETPGLEAFSSDYEIAVEWLENDSAKATETVKKSLGNHLTSYTPGILVDLAKATDPLERETRGETIPETTINKAKRNIPGLRQTLPSAINVHGEERKTELGMAGLTGAISQVMFGSRVKTANTDAAAEEIAQLSKEGHVPKLTNLEWSNSSKVGRLKEKVGDDWRETKIEFGQGAAKRIKELIDSKEYQNLTPEQKAERIEEVTKESLEEVYAQNGIWDANQDPVKAKRKYEMGKVKEKYDKLLSQGKASEAKKLLSGLTDDELDAFEYHVRRGLKGEDNSQSLEQITTRLKQLPPPARKVEAKKMIEQSMLTRDNINTLVKENKDIKQALLDTDYSDLHNNYKQAKAVATYEEIGGDWDKIEDIKDSNLGNKLEELYTADKHGLDEEEAEMIGAPYKKRAEIMREKIKDMSESEKDRYIRKLEKAGVVPDGITEKGNRSKSELEDRERLLSMID